MKKTMFWTLLLALALCSAAGAAPLLFDGFSPGEPGDPPRYWTGTSINSPTDASVSIVDLDGELVAEIWDANGDNIGRRDLNRRFPHYSSGTGITVQFDVQLDQTTAGCGFRVTNGGNAVSAAMWAVGLIFEGNTAWAPGGGSGKISYQTHSGANAYALTGATYTANIWYTVKVVIDMDAKKHTISFGPRGGTLTEIVANEDLIWNTGSNSQVKWVAGVTFFGSQVAGDSPGSMFVDNVSVDGNIDPLVDLATIGDAKNRLMAENKIQPNFQPHEFVRLTGKTVTMGDAQSTGGFFYMQDESGGIRVRTESFSDHPEIMQGDVVTVEGILHRSSDNGYLVDKNGEKEILATSVVVTGTAPLPSPVAMTNKAIGGGHFGPNELADGATPAANFPGQPGVYGSGVTAATNPGLPEIGLNNIGRLGMFFGKVVYNEVLASPFFCIDDGSEVPYNAAFNRPDLLPEKGVRVHLKGRTQPLWGIDGKFVVIRGIPGGISCAELLNGTTIANLRVIRPVEEPWEDLNGNGLWDPGEPYTDLNGNGAYDGIIVLD